MPGTPRYPTLLFDLDHTLLDSDESERRAYAHTMATVGLDEPETQFARFVDINRAMWRAVEAGDIQPADVRHRRFERFIAELELEADPAEMADAFVWGLAHHGELYDGALALLTSLAETHRLAIVTNGLTYVQNTRIARLGIGGLFDAVTVSETIGMTKPRAGIFDATFAALGEPDRTGALMIGDSLTSDIAGGRNAGIDTCWYNPHAKPLDDDATVTHEVRAFDEILAIVSD